MWEECPMSRTLTSAVVALGLIVSVASAQQQSGVPAKMKISGVDQTIPVFLQRVENGRLVFQRYRQPKDLAGPLNRIEHLEFLANFDLDGARELYRTGKFEELITKMETGLEPSINEYWPYMRIDNNFQDVFCMLTRVYLELGDYEKATKAAAILMESTNPSTLSTGQSVSILIALKENRIEDAEALLPSISSPAGVLYYRACIERAKNQPKDAMQLVTELIADYGNDLDWMPKAELLSANLYQDMAATQPDPYLDSAKQTARQVKNFYAGTHIAALAERLEASIAELQAKIEAEKAAQAEAEEKAKAKVRARAEARAKAVFGEEKGSSDQTGTESNDEGDSNTETGTDN